MIFVALALQAARLVPSHPTGSWIRVASAGGVAIYFFLTAARSTHRAVLVVGGLTAVVLGAFLVVTSALILMPPRPGTLPHILIDASLLVVMLGTWVRSIE